MLPVIIKIGDVEYRTGSFIRNQPYDGDWLMIADMVSNYVNDKLEEPEWFEND